MERKTIHDDEARIVHLDVGSLAWVVGCSLYAELYVSSFLTEEFDADLVELVPLGQGW